MLYEWIQYYCKTCDSIFKARISKSYYTLNHWIENQWQLIDKHDKRKTKRHNLTVPITIVNCPFCHSMHNADVQKILNMFVVYTKTGKLISPARLYSLPKYKRYAKVHQKIIAKHLNSIEDKEKSVKT